MSTKFLFFAFIAFLTLPLSGQTLLKDVEDGIPGSGSAPQKWCAVNDSIFIFQAMNVLQSQFLYASDGTEAGTIGLGMFQPETDIVRLGNKAYFGGCNISYSADSCTSLYVSDGTAAGTQFFFDLVPGGLSLDIEDIVAGDSLFFFSGHTPNEGIELWRSNGTVEGTYRVADIASGPENGYRGKLAVFNDVAYFAGYTPQAGMEPWRSDGTPSGTYMITDLNDGPADSQPDFFTASGGYVYFSGLGTQSGREVFRTTGAQENIQIIGETGTTDSSNPRDFVDSDGILYYVAVGEGSAGYDLYAFDHTSTPVHIDFAIGDIFPRSLIPFGNGQVIFNAEDTVGRELWISDGTQAGTRRIVDLYPGPEDGVFGIGNVEESFYAVGDSLVYFAGADSINAKGDFTYELFVTDGTAMGTQLVSDQVPGPDGANPGKFFEFGNRLYFAATDPVVGLEPFYLELSNTTSAKIESSPIVKLPYPNPLPDGRALNLTIDLPTAAEITAQLYDINGRLIQEIKGLGHFPTGENTLKIEIDDSRSGLCFLILNAGTMNQYRMSIMLE